MTSGSLVDLDPPAPRERRWPFLVGWAIGGAVIGAVLVTHLPATFIHQATVVEPVVTEAPLPTAAPAVPRLLPPAQQPRFVPIPTTPTRP